MDSYYESYCNYIKNEVLGMDLEESNFKSHPDFTHMLENITAAYGKKYDKCIVEEFGDFIAKNKDGIISLISKNDAIGRPGKFVSEIFGECGIYNLRYIFHTLLILDHIRKKEISSTNIIEVGAGYGGLCFYVVNLAEMAGVKIESYSIIDLEMPLSLQEKCLNYYGTKIPVTLLENTSYQDKLDKDYFFVSTYAIGEFSEPVRDEYIRNLIPKCSHGFAEWNVSPYKKFEVDLGLDGKLPYDVIPERPDFGINSSFVYF